VCDFDEIAEREGIIQLLFSAPAFVKITVSFLSILLIYRVTGLMGAGMIISSVVLFVWTGIGPGRFQFVFSDLLRTDNFLLFVVILFLIFFTHVLSETGRIEKTITILKGIFRSPRLLLAALPALIGLIPMPGGALFSAPLVDSIGSGNALPAAKKTAINYWFRHIWEYWWPLYPGVVVALQYSAVPVWFFIVIQAPLTLFSVLFGSLFLLRTAPPSPASSHSNPTGGLGAALIPIGILVGSTIFVSTVLKQFGISATTANLTGMGIGLCGGFLPIVFSDAKALVPSLSFFGQAKTWKLMLVVAGVLLFSTVIRTPLLTGETLVTHMRDESAQMGIPVVLIIMIIPFVSGIVTGIAVGFVGASFPLVFALVSPDSAPHILAPTIVLAFGFGYIGMMLSPVHICFVVTNEYYKTRFSHSYRYILLPAVGMCCAAVGLAAAYYYLLP
jgi:hypothetical protein